MAPKTFTFIFHEMGKKTAFIIGHCYLKASWLPDDNGSDLRLCIPGLKKESHRRVCAQHLYDSWIFLVRHCSQNICISINPFLEAIFGEQRNAKMSSYVRAVERVSKPHPGFRKGPAFQDPFLSHWRPTLTFCRDPPSLRNRHHLFNRRSGALK